jgi:hypothetical protein
VGVVIAVLVVAAAWANWGMLFGSSRGSPEAASEDGPGETPAVRDAKALWRSASKGGARQLPKIEAAMGDSRPEVREAAVVSLGFFADRADSGKVARLLRKDSSPAVRSAAAGLLRRQKKWDNMPALADGLRDPSEAVRRRAYRAICEMLGMHFPYDPAVPPERSEADVRRFEKFYPTLEQDYRRFLRRKKEAGR